MYVYFFMFSSYEDKYLASAFFFLRQQEQIVQMMHFTRYGKYTVPLFFNSVILFPSKILED